MDLRHVAGDVFFNGTAFFVDINGRCCLVTCGHVLDLSLSEGKSVFLVSGSSGEPTSFELFCFDDIIFRDDVLDCCVACVSSEVPMRLGCEVFSIDVGFSLDDFLEEEGFLFESIDYVFFGLGYPGIGRRVESSVLIRMSMMGWVLSCQRIDDCVIVLCEQNNPELFMFSGLNVRDSGNLGGISGAPVWSGFSKQGPRLVGYVKQGTDAFGLPSSIVHVSRIDSIVDSLISSQSWTVLGQD